MRILHATSNTANQGFKLARAQTVLGHVSDCLVYTEDCRGFRYDINLRLTRGARWPRRWRERTGALVRWAPRYEVFHFHSTGFLDMMLDLPLLKAWGKTVVVHFHGYELYPLFAAETARQLYGDYAAGGRDKLYARVAVVMARRFADAVLVSEPEMAPWIEGAIWVPQPLDLDNWATDAGPSHATRSGRYNIVHAPTGRAKKGTAHVEAAISSLQAKGYPVELTLVENTPYEQTKALYQQADILVDQLLCGWYGNVSCEAMALGKPVCVYIRPDLIPSLGSCPVVNVTPQTLEPALAALMQDGELRRRLGRRGQAYVAEVHDAVKIASQCIDIYRQGAG